MAERKLDGDAESLYSGRLEGISLPDLIWMLRADRKTGVLTVRRFGIEKSVYFDQGSIVFAASTDPDDRLGELLLRQGTITLDQLEQALADLHLGKRLGTLLVEAGAMGADRLVQAVLMQVQQIVLDLFSWEQGDYRFEQGPLPTDEVITLNMKTNEILRSGIRRIRSFVRTRRSVGPPRTVYGLADDWREEIERLSLSEPEQLVIAGLEQGDRSIDQLCRDVVLSNFEIHETLWALKVQGTVVERVGQFAGDDDASHHGNLEAGGFVKALVGLSREKATGVLYVRRRADERSFHFRQGRCEFATSSNPDHGLVAYLLMRGVISLRDRQETDKRLLSNKRVGTILRELGVIDDKDLHVMVRQQLSEIVFDTFRFEDGDLSFVPGEPHSSEEITLDTSAESLVLEGVRRVTSWSRVQLGCGGMDSHLELTPEYMDVLDAMGAGAAEWQVVTALKSGKTAREICRHTKLDDFRTCQILWALRELGAVQELDATASVAEAESDESVEPTVAEPTPAAAEPVAAGLASAESAAEAVESSAIESPSAVPLEAEGSPGVGAIPVEMASPLADAVAKSESLSPQQTQVISREAIRAALGDSESAEAVEPSAGSESEVGQGPSIDATQAVPAQVVKAALGAGPSQAEARCESEQAEQSVEAIEIDESFVEPGSRPAVPPAAPSVPQHALEPDARELDISTRTMQLPRETVDAALEQARGRDAAGAPQPDVAPQVESESPSTAGPPEAGWELPGDLETIIEQFNAMQRVVYRAIRAEVGAGAANFIRSCCDTTGHAVDPLKGAELQSDGSWDIEGLRRAVSENRIREPRLVYQALIEREIDLLRAHIGEARVLELERQIEQVEQAAPNDR